MQHEIYKVQALRKEKWACSIIFLIDLQTTVQYLYLMNA